MIHIPITLAKYDMCETLMGKTGFKESCFKAEFMVHVL
jgi:hypothetical protein